MDNTIKIITDSGCDISKENEERYKDILELIPFMVTINGKSYADRKDIQPDEFYKILKEQQEIPKHSQITAIQFEDKYRELYEQGVRTIIVDVINAAGSQTYSNAVLAKQNVAEDLKDLTIYTIDAQNYTLCYGYPIIEACKKLEAGQPAKNVAAYLEDWGKHADAYIIGFELRHMKKSGRISAAASFLGELMGLKPLIYLGGAKTEVIRKARGEKAVIDAAVETIASRIIPQTPWCVITTTRPECEKEFIDKMTKKLGYGPAMVEKCGVVVSCNAGPEFIGVLTRGEEHPAKD
ncbi:MAG: DegV family protein [Oscillospiraceae bacterium]|nr:DegV family protein [Oscillospiraceae bacterium]